MEHHDVGEASDPSDAQARLAFLLALSDTLRPLADPVAVQGEASRILAEHLGVERAYYVHLDEAAGDACVERDFVRGAAPSLAGQHRIADFAWSVAILRRGECHVVDDTQTSPLVPEADRPACQALRISACMGAPLIKEGRLVGALCVTDSRPHLWTPLDVSLLREVAERLWATIERARAEEALRVSERRLRNVLDGMGECFGLMDRDLRIVTQNEAALRLDGRPLETLRGRTHAEVYPNANPELERLYRLALAEGVPVSLEHCHEWPDGSVNWFAIRAFPVPEGLAVFWSDITQRKLAAIALQESQERQSFLLTLSDALRPLADAVAILEVSARLLGEHLGASRVFYGEFVCIDGVEYVVIEREYRFGDIPSFVGRHQAEKFGPLRSLLAAGRVVADSDIEAGSPSEPLLKAYRALQARARLGVPLVKDGRLVAALGVHSPVPRQWTEREMALVQETTERTWAAVERARAEDNARQRSAQLEQQARQLRRLASELTLTEHKTRELLSKTLHDHLQQLLFAAGLKLDRAVARLQDDDLLRSVRHDLQEAVAATRSLSLDLFPPVLRNEGLPDALEWIADWARRKFDVTVVIDADPAADPEDLDTRILLFESVRELVFNAVKHAHVDKVQVDLSLEPGDRVQLIVADEGAGFAVQEGTGAPGEHLGLGLFGIRQRVALMGGEMSVESAPGEGTCFRLTVPRRSAKASFAQVSTDVGQAQVRPATAEEAPVPVPGSPLRVLLVDDHALVREGLKRVLATHPELACVGEAADGLEAIEQARALRPDVVVMDTSMPVLDGVAATRRIKAEFPGMRVVGLSTMQAARPQAIERAGAVARFDKRDGLQALVQWLLDAQAARVRKLPAQKDRGER